MQKYFLFRISMHPWKYLINLSSINVPDWNSYSPINEISLRKYFTTDDTYLTPNIGLTDTIFWNSLLLFFLSFFFYFQIHLSFRHQRQWDTRWDSFLCAFITSYNNQCKICEVVNKARPGTWRVEISSYGFVPRILESIDQGLPMAVGHRVYVSGSNERDTGWCLSKEKPTKSLDFPLIGREPGGIVLFVCIHVYTYICMYISLDIKVVSRPCPPISLWTSLLDATMMIFHVVDWYCKGRKVSLKWPWGRSEW